MSIRILSAQVALLGVLLSCPAMVWGGDAANPDDGAVILVPDDPTSTATIDGPWSQPIHIRVVTISDAPALSDPDADPSLPGRIATAIRDENGDLVHLNLVEARRQTTTVRTRIGSRDFVEWIINTDLPFTRQAELDALLEGTAIRRPQRLGDLGGREVVCHRTGEDVIEVPVFYDATRPRPANYAVQIVTELFPPGKTAPGEDGGGDPGGDGGDPGGDPSPPGFIVEDGGGPPEGGDPGGDPSPPLKFDTE